MKIQISLSTQYYFHGSPYSNILFDKDRITYFTQNIKVATAYAKGDVANTGRQIDKSLVKSPTVYECILKLGPIFDFRKQWAEYETLHKAAKKSVFHEHDVFLDDDSKYHPMPKLDSIGFIMKSGLPGYGHTEEFKVLLTSHLCPKKYDGILIDEGSQGTSIAVFDPRHKVTIVQEISV